MFIILFYIITRSITYFFKYLFGRIPEIDNRYEDNQSNSNDKYNNENEPTNFGESSEMNDITDARMLTLSDKPKQKKFAKFDTPKDSSTYSMRKRGKCVVFNHKTFENGREPDRKGTEYDGDMIKETFSALGFEVRIYKDKRFQDIINIITNLQNENHDDCDCICFFILTHGTIGDYVGAYDMLYPVQMIWQSFNGDNCPSLAGKPKLFFIQSCRGIASDTGIQGRFSNTDSDEMTYMLPSTADFLYAFSTVEGYYSFRDPNRGSWYIHTLCEVIKEHWRDCDMLQMLTITLWKIATEYSSEHYDSSLNKKKQMPIFTSTLTRDLYFNSNFVEQ